MIEPFKYLIQPVAIERDDETGRIVREIPGEVIAVFSAEDAARAVTEFEGILAQHAEQNGQPIEEEVTDAR